MFEVNMDEYLDEETEHVKTTLDSICRTWTSQLDESGEAQRAQSSGPTFLTASNPDQVKRNVLAGFKDVLLLPVTIVPRTVTFGVNALVSGSTQAVNGLSMLNPQKWAGSNGTQVVKPDVVEDEALPPIPVPAPSPQPITPATGSTDQSFDRLQLLVSLDVALELIHADRDALKRTETFARYPGKCGHRVRETIEEIFILMLKAVADRHIAPGFRMYVAYASELTQCNQPDEHI